MVGGVVCFLPSYDFEQQFMEHLKRHDHISKLERKKKLFREPKKANEVDATLSEYSQCIRLGANRPETGRNGALLLCVVGKLLSFTEFVNPYQLIVSIVSISIQSINQSINSIKLQVVS